MRKSKLYVCFLIIILICSGVGLYAYFHLQSKTRDLKMIKIGSQSLNVEIANTEELRELGLGNRDAIGSADGMLFVFDTPGTYGFWMKDMKFDIDILWIDKDQKVIGFEKNVSKNSYPQVFYPKKEVKYSLELKAGSIDEQGIKVNDLLSPTF